MIRSLWLLFVKQYSPLRSTVTSLHLLSARPWTSSQTVKKKKKFMMVHMCSFYITFLALYISMHIDWFKLVWKLFVVWQLFNVDWLLDCCYRFGDVSLVFIRQLLQKKSPLECLDFFHLILPGWIRVYFLCVCVLGVGHGAAEPGEQAVNRISRQWTSSMGHQLPGGGEGEHSWTQFSVHASCSAHCNRLILGS